MIRAALRSILRVLRSYWVFFWRERFGYKRPSAITPEMLEEHDRILQRLQRLRVELAMSDTALDLWELDSDRRGKRR